MTKVVIVGCGWLGMQLAEKLCKSGCQVWGSTSNTERQQRLQSIGAHWFLWSDFKDESKRKEITIDTHTLIIALPPSSFGVENYAPEIEILIHHFNSITQVIFCSSTSVYGEGELEVDEATPLNPETQSAAAIVSAEQVVAKWTKSPYYILRLGGLYGEGRNLAKYFQAKTNVAAPFKPVNLIDGATIAKLVMQLVFDEHASGIYNVVNPQHPTRMEYYTTMCLKFGWVAPQFLLSDMSAGKIVSTQKLIANFKLQFPELID